MSVTALIFSRNRAMQLDLLLRSIQKYAPEMFNRVIVLWRVLRRAAEATDYERAYAELMQQKRGNLFIREEGDGDFARAFGEAMESVDEHVCFFCDDDVMFREPDPLFIPPNGNPPFVGYSLRLGINTSYNYMRSCPQSQSTGSYAYLFSLDGTIYRTADVLRWIKGETFCNPNELEHKIAAKIHGNGVLAFSGHSCVVSIPANVVTDWPKGNRHAASHSAEKLNQRYLAGARIDLEAMDFSNVVGCHQEIEYCFTSSYRDIPASYKKSHIGALTAGLPADGPSPEAKRPKFSIIHPTARLPRGWHAAYDQLMLHADCPDEIEYVLCVDEKDSYCAFDGRHLNYEGRSFKLAINRGRNCVVDAGNAAAAASTGENLVWFADDVFMPPHWVAQVLEAIAKSDIPIQKNGEYVVWTSTRNPRDNVQLFQWVMSRKRYERFGYIEYPEYLGMYADDEFTEQSFHDGVVIDARHICFEQRHPAFGTAPMDAVYERENSKDSYRLGKEILERRRKECGFSYADRPQPARTTQTILFALPGENFSKNWVAGWTKIYGKMLTECYEKEGVRYPKFTVIPEFLYTTNVYVTRHEYVSDILKFKPDLVCWIDDDNPPTPEQIFMLLADLEQHPELDGVAGWCWTGHDDPNISCGRLGENGLLYSFKEESFFSSPADLIPIEYSGFPLLLTRGSVYGKLGKFPFRAVLNDDHSRGMTGEDGSFFIKARKGSTKLSMEGIEFEIVGAGLSFAVDRRVQIEHLKTNPVKKIPKPAKQKPEDAAEVLSQEGAVPRPNGKSLEAVGQ